MLTGKLYHLEAYKQRYTQNNLLLSHTTEFNHVGAYKEGPRTTYYYLTQHS